ncbi:MAG TPA: hypothetical protein PKA88_07445 [Polyangiaceae bacterium]|nr:hypothetical protein [Polyangiaceae bacterium]HMR73920.1 hypothetical protein [Polyangiaceae bacterium]
MQNLGVGGHGGAVLLVVAALLGCKKLDIDAKVTGYKPESNTVVIVHVKTAKNTRVSCASSGLSCAGADTNFAGELDLEVDLEGDNSEKTSKVVELEVRAGSRTARKSIDLAAAGLPPKLDVEDDGTIACVGRKCSGTLTYAPAGRLELEVESGTTATLGSETFKAEDGDIDSPVTIATTPPLKELPLSTLCAKEAQSLGATTLTLTFPDAVKVSTEIKLDSEGVAGALKTALEGVDKAPVLFPWEAGAKPDIPKKRRAALYLGTAICAAAGPTDATLSDVMVVALATTQTREDTCTYQLSEKTSGAARGTSTGKLTLHDAVASAYNRLTGAKLATRTFQATKACREDLDLSSVTEVIPDQSVFVSETTIAAWAGTVAK